MKLILAVIRISKMNETRKALSDAGLPSFTAMSVLGRGAGRGVGQTFQAVISNPETEQMLQEAGPVPRLKAKRMITLVVADEKKDLAVETIIKTNQTNNSGDGKIFVLEALGSISVRTGASGTSTLD